MTERVLGPSGSERRKTRLLVLTALAAAAFTVFFVAASSANLPSSPTSAAFESNDGNLDAGNNGGTYDWNGPTPEAINCNTGANCGVDPVNSSSDNSLGQGSKEDSETVSVVTGSIPPQKDDLSRFYVNKQKVAISGVDHQFLYMAWERSNTLGSAHMDFEFNQAPVGITASSSGDVALNRTAGDLLIDFDFGGSGPVALFLHRWITTGDPADCEASNALPCWNKGVVLAAGVAEAQVNNTNVTDTNLPGPNTLPGSVKSTGQGTTVSSTFGEAGIDLTAANVFPANRCFHLGDAWLKSRSSGSSFTSELKDFVAPIPVNITNCGEIKIIKRSAPTRGIDQNFSFTSDIPNPTDNPVVPTSQPYCQADTGPSAFTLNDKDANVTPPAAPHDSAANTEDCVNVLNGTYHVTESALPNGWALDSISCSKSPANGTSTFSTDTTTRIATINLVAGEVVTCVYTDKQQLGAIKITKTSTKGSSGLNGATFSIKKNGTGITGSPFTTATIGGVAGVICVDNLAFGDYAVKEESAPNGYQIDDTTTATITVDNNAKCSDTPYVGESKAYTDTPVGEIEVRFTNTSGVMTSQIVCKEGSTVLSAVSENGDPDATPPKRDDTDETFNNLDTGVYTCTIDVDP